MANKGVVTVTVTPADVYVSDDSPQTDLSVTTIMIYTDPVGAQVYINIPGMHKAGDFWAVPNGIPVPFRRHDNSINKVTLKTLSSTNDTIITPCVQVIPGARG